MLIRRAHQLQRKNRSNRSWSMRLCGKSWIINNCEQIAMTIHFVWIKCKVQKYAVTCCHMLSHAVKCSQMLSNAVTCSQMLPLICYDISKHSQTHKWLIWCAQCCPINKYGRISVDVIHQKCTEWDIVSWLPVSTIRAVIPCNFSSKQSTSSFNTYNWPNHFNLLSCVVHILLLLHIQKAHWSTFSWEMETCS